MIEGVCGGLMCVNCTRIVRALPFGACCSEQCEVEMNRKHLLAIFAQPVTLADLARRPLTVNVRVEP